MNLPAIPGRGALRVRQVVDDAVEYGEWIADVEKPAAEYRGRYQLRLSEARKLLK